jgi:hypothetical protein
MYFGLAQPMTRVRRLAWIPPLCLALVVQGCARNVYEIEMQAEGPNVQRTLQARQVRQDTEGEESRALEEHELRRIARAYDVDVPQPVDGSSSFQGSFSGRLPNDVGGHGSYRQWTSPLGSTTVYLERFRGNDDLSSQLADRQRAADQAVDLVMGWLASELEDHPAFPPLRAFLDGGFRRDMKNLSVYVWTFSVVSEDQGHNVPLRMIQYLLERGYFEVDEFPAVVRDFEDLQREKPQRALARVQRLVASRMGVAATESVPPDLAFLADKRSIEESFERYGRSTGEYQRRLKEWRLENGSAPDAEPPSATDVLGAHLVRAFAPNLDFLRGPDKLDVTLRLPARPFLTNGDWNDTDEVVQWSDSINQADAESTEWPVVLYAFWSMPQENVQTQQFGRVVLDGRKLGEYCLWYGGLSPKEQQEWDALLQTFDADGPWIERLKTFRFAADGEQRQEDTGDAASTGIDLLTDVLAEQ